MNRIRIAVLYGSMALMIGGLLFAASTAPDPAGSDAPAVAPAGECPAMKRCPALRDSDSRPSQPGSGTGCPALDRRLVV